ncbi:restriction endonuclease subunit S [uncultured Psychrobacter sp.]|uniref:restriction endonuclease subunit S n=1 Tax=uncultured Psychrobacter sp. TaxID=259303 RepID=UPI00345AE5CD
MRFEWTTLGKFIKVQGGYAYKSKDFIPLGSNRVLKIKNIRFGSVDYDDTVFIRDELASATCQYKTKPKDILISMTGSGPNAPNSLVGRVARIWEDEPDAWINQRVGRLELIEEQSISLDFIYYLLTEKKAQDFLVSNSSGSANQANINGKTIESLPCPNVSFSKSKTISQVLLSFDKKIQLNNQINQTLEAMAQAIFKSWFVDFDPVRAKREVLDSGGSIEDAERSAMRAISSKTNEQIDEMAKSQLDEFAELQRTASLFPSELEDSELGKIPEGWEVSRVEHVSECFDKYRIPLSKKQRIARQGNIPYYGATSVMDYVDEAIFEGMYMLLGEDGSVIKKDGKPFLQYIWGESWVNNHAHVLQGKNGISTEHLMIFFSLKNVSAYVTGAVQLKINQGNMKSIPFLKATNHINDIFNSYLDKIYAKYRKNTDENQTLAELRDTLLPKLLSGKLDVSGLAEMQDD